MREQIQRLNKKPQVNTQLGQIGTGTTAVVNMPTVAPTKSNGAKLVEAFGQVVETGAKVYTQYQKQSEAEQKQLEADMKVKSKQKAQLDYFSQQETLANLDNSGKASYIESVIHKAAQDGDATYLNSITAFYDKDYKSALEGANKEYRNGVIKPKAVSAFTAGLMQGEFNYDEMSSWASSKGGRRSDYHTYVKEAMENAIVLKAGQVQSPEDLKEFTTWSNSIMAKYNDNKFLGGSTSKNAVDIQTKIKKQIASATTSIQKTYKENFNLEVAQTEETIDVTPAIFNDKIDAGLKNDVITKADAYKKKNAYQKKYTERENTENDIASFDPMQDNNAKWEAGLMTNEAKKQNKNSVIKTLGNAINNKNFTSINNIVMGNKNIAMPIVKTFLEPTGNAEHDSKAVQFYADLKNSKEGQYIINNLDVKKKAILDIIDLNETQLGATVDYKELYENANSKETVDLNRTERVNLKNTYAGLPQEMRDTMYQYSQVLLKGGMSYSNVKEKIKDLVTENTMELGGVFSTTDIKAVNFDASPLASQGQENILEVIKAYGEANDLTVDNTTMVYDTSSNQYSIYEEGNSIFPLKIVDAKEFEEFGTKFSKAKLDEQIAEADEDRMKAINEQKALKNSFKYPYYETEGGSGVTSFSGDFGDINIDTEAFKEAVENNPLLNAIGNIIDGIIPSAQGSELPNNTGDLFNDNITWLEGDTEHMDIVNIQTTPYGINRKAHSKAIKQYAKDINKKESELSKEDYKILSNNMFDNFKQELSSVSGFSTLTDEQQAAVTFAKFNTGQTYKKWIKSFNDYNANPSEANFKQVIKNSTRTADGKRVKGLDNRALKELIISGVVDLDNKQQMKTVLSILNKADTSLL